LRFQTYSGQGSSANANYISNIETNGATGVNDMSFGVWGGGALGLSEVLRLQEGTGFVGVGTSTPGAQLSVFKPFGSSAGTLFSIASSTNTANNTNTSFLSVSATGFGTT
jgi:hypothetical protein